MATGESTAPSTWATLRDLLQRERTTVHLVVVLLGGTMGVLVALATVAEALTAVALLASLALVGGLAGATFAVYEAGRYAATRSAR